jgi:predicted Zn-dependent protease
MREEDEPKDNGGITQDPAGTEYREGGRYSDRFRPESAADETKKESGADEAEDAASLPRGNMTREEMERRYRDDPRFAMLFDHGEEGDKKSKAGWSIKVGGIRLTPTRILILGVFFLIVLICLGASVVYAIRDIGKYKDFSRAVALYEAGDYDDARMLFVKVLSEDPNKEPALRMMAEIYHHFGDWNNEAFFRQRIMRLNPLDRECFHAFLESAFRARNFGTIYSILNLRFMENPELPPDEGALFLISALNSGHVSHGRDFCEAMKKSDPNYFSDTERGRFGETLLASAGLNREKARSYISTLDQIQDPQVRFEMMDMLVHFLSTQRDREADSEMEKLLLQAAELNEFAGAPMLANYYYMRYRFEDTMRVCDGYFKTKVNAVMPVLYGESCVLSGQPELLPPAADKIRQLSGRQSRMLAAYLDALGAFSKGDDDAMQRFLQVAGPTIETPLSSLMRLQLALKQDSPKDILQRLGRIMKGRPFMDFQQRARTAALQYLLKKADADLLSHPDRLNLCAEVASLIQTPEDDVSFLQRIILMDRFKRKLLTEEDLLSALRAFPGDPIFLRVASEFYLMNGKAAHAMDYIAEAKAMPDFPEDMKPFVNVLYLLALDQLGRRDDAEKEFRNLVEQDKGERLLCPYYEFCVENGFVDSLKSLAEMLASLPEDSAKRAALPFVQAEILLNEGKKDEALDLFEKSDSKDPRFIFHAATRLAEAGRNDAAFERYVSIRDTYPDKALVNINLSELYSEKGDKEHALASARTAWQEDQNNLLSRYIYGKRLYEGGQYADAIAVLKFPQYKASFPEEMLDLWSKAIREQIKADYYAERYTPALENAKFLLIYFPDDRFGKDYLERVERIRRHETVGGNM